MKSCIECKHWHFFAGGPGYSEWTPGSEWSSDCNKGHWSLDGKYATEAVWRRTLRLAQVCADFEAAEATE